MSDFTDFRLKKLELEVDELKNHIRQLDIQQSTDAQSLEKRIKSIDDQLTVLVSYVQLISHVIETGKSSLTVATSGTNSSTLGKVELERHSLVRNPANMSESSPPREEDDSWLATGLSFSLKVPSKKESSLLFCKEQKSKLVFENLQVESPNPKKIGNQRSVKITPGLFINKEFSLKDGWCNEVNKPSRKPLPFSSRPKAKLTVHQQAKSNTKKAELIHFEVGQKPKYVFDNFERIFGDKMAAETTTVVNFKERINVKKDFICNNETQKLLKQQTHLNYFQKYPLISPAVSGTALTANKEEFEFTSSFEELRYAYYCTRINGGFGQGAKLMKDKEKVDFLLSGTDILAETKLSHGQTEKDSDSSSVKDLGFAFYGKDELHSKKADCSEQETKLMTEKANSLPGESDAPEDTSHEYGQADEDSDSLSVEDELHSKKTDCSEQETKLMTEKANSLPSESDAPEDTRHENGQADEDSDSLSVEDELHSKKTDCSEQETKLMTEKANSLPSGSDAPEDTRHENGQADEDSDSLSVEDLGFAFYGKDELHSKKADCSEQETKLMTEKANSLPGESDAPEDTSHEYGQADEDSDSLTLSVCPN